MIQNKFIMVVCILIIMCSIIAWPFLKERTDDWYTKNQVVLNAQLPPYQGSMQEPTQRLSTLTLEQSQRVDTTVLWIYIAYGIIFLSSCMILFVMIMTFQLRTVQMQHGRQFICHHNEPQYNNSHFCFDCYQKFTKHHSGFE